MVDQLITIAPATRAAIPAIVDLMHAQQSRQLLRDPHLRHVDTRAQLETTLREHINEQAIVALNAEGRVRGYAQPSVWPLKETSILRAFLSARNGIVQKLTLPDPADEDANAVVAALLTALDQVWRDAGTTGDLVRWPSKDNWFDADLARQRFQLDSVCAFRPLLPFFAIRPASNPLVRIRTARPEDEDALVALFDEEVRYHERYIPFAHSSPEVTAAFRKKLKGVWEGKGLADGAPLVLVADKGGTVVGMAENTLVTLTTDDEPGFTPAGDYWCLDNVSVREDYHSQGIGRLLVQAV